MGPRVRRSEPDGPHLGWTWCRTARSWTRPADRSSRSRRSSIARPRGDGQLRHPGTEQIAEVHYKRPVTRWLQVTVDYQAIFDPGYNRDNGPVLVFGLRLHVQP